MSKTKKRDIGKSVWIFFIVVILVIILGLIVTSMIFKNPDVTPSAFGYSFFIVDEDGMGDAVPKGSLVVAKNYSPSADNLGDAILCEKVEGYGTTILRLCNIVPNTKSVVYQGFFDNDPETIIDVPSKNLIGKASSYHMNIGKFITFVTSYKGMAVMVVVPILMLLVCELIIGLFSKRAEKNNIRKEKFRKKLDAYKIPENSPLSPEKIGQHSGPVTIEDFIFGHEEKLKNRNDEKSNNRRGKASADKETEQTKQVERPKAAAVKAYESAKKDAARVERSDRSRATSQSTQASQTMPERKAAEQPVRQSARAESVRASRPTERRSEGTAAFEAGKADALREERILRRREQEAQQAKAKEGKPAEQPKEPQNPAEAPVVKEAPAEEAKAYKSSNESLAQLIKLMEEQEKLLKEKANKD